MLTKLGGLNATKKLSNSMYGTYAPCDTELDPEGVLRLAGANQRIWYKLSE